jgi:hypothetical protein
MVHLRSTVGLIEFLQSMGNPKGGDWSCRVMAKGVDLPKGRRAGFAGQAERWVRLKEKSSVAGQGARDGQPLFLPTAEGMDGSGC